MVKEFVESWNKRKVELERYIKETPQEKYSSYEELVKLLVEEIINPDCDDWYKYDSSKIHVIDDGDYQGMKVFLVPTDTYQPSQYLITSVYYGSCSGCDTLLGISQYEDGLPTDGQVEDYMTLLLHLLQKTIVFENSYWED